MKFKKSILIIIILVGFICISISSAHEDIAIEHNTTNALKETNTNNIIAQPNQNLILEDSSKELQVNLKPKTFEKSQDMNYVVKVDNYNTDFPGEKIWLKLYVTYPNGYETDTGSSYIRDGYVTFSLTGLHLDTGKYTITLKPSDENYKITHPTSYITVVNPTIQEDQTSSDESTHTTTVNNVKVSSTITPKVKAQGITVKPKANSYFKVIVKTQNNKPVKNLKLKIKVWTGKKTKTYTVTTNKNGFAKLSTKKLTAGNHKVQVTSANKKYSISKSSKIVVQPVTFKLGKYRGTFTLKQLRTIKKAKANWYCKTITINTNQYVNGKYRVKMGISSFAIDGRDAGKNKYFLEAWSSYGPIAAKKIVIY